MWFAWSLLLPITVCYAHQGIDFHCATNDDSSLIFTYTTPEGIGHPEAICTIILFQDDKYIFQIYYPSSHSVQDGLSPATKYRCKALITFRGKEEVYENEAWTLPSTPSLPTLDQSHSNYIVIKATPIPDNRQNYFYKLRWSISGGHTVEDHCVGLMCNVTGLQPVTSYSFSVVGCFTIIEGQQWGRSAVSGSINEWTVPPNPNAIISKVGHDSLEVRYEPVVGGQYTYKLFSNDTTTECNQESKTCVLENLQSGSQCTMTVLACFMVPGGSGEICSNVAQGRMTHWTAPNAVAEASLKRREPTLLEVQFTPLEDHKYTYTYKLRTNDQEVTCGDDVCVINNLDPSTLYTMKIAACFIRPDGYLRCGNFDDKVIEEATSSS